MTVMKNPSMNTNMHSAFKREILRLRDGVSKTDLADPEAVAGLQKRYHFFSATLHHHHQGEDKYLWPNVYGNADPEEQVVLDSMEAEHEALAEVLDTLDREFADLGPGSDTAKIKTDLDQLRALLLGHTQHEERDGVPIVQKYLEEPEYKEFLKFNRSSETASMVLPWMCDGATPNEIESTWGVVPAPVRLILKPVMTRKYRKFSVDCGV